MSLFAVTVLGHDRPGIVADTTAALARLGGNLEDSTMTLLGGHFAMLLLVRTGSGREGVEHALQPLGADGLLTVDVREVTDDAATPAPASDLHVLSVHGADRAGIVSAVTGVLAGAGGNVTDLTTRLAGGLYVLLADVALPASVDVAALRQALAATADELGVDVSLRPVDTDEL
ncbi:glycine cleavage system protein R [Angustibacter sp. Root456]|uniref:glycine cleavage system protein R n=1 Tax=Angustibacter sp. Root456 TaxID=1736539 RepID=UPI0006F3185D|nr:ACT domain-containing protein [Angustibacter sp. Root456]KQX69355.1 amino acid-binding protein [Angustibacter sp. Root456]